MARMAVADLEAAVSVENRCLRRPPEAHLRSTDRHRPVAASPIPETLEMTEFRHRVQTGGASSTGRGLSNESSADSSPTLTPSSSEDPGHATENSGLLSMVKTVSYSLLALVKSKSPTRPTPEEVEALKTSRGHHKFNYERVDDYPKGYSQYAAFTNSCDTFANIRRFGRLSSRILAHLQNDLTGMEKALDELDMKDSQDRIKEKRLRGYENFNGWDEEQRELISKIASAYSVYADVALKDASFRALGKCPQRNTKALFTWVWNRKPFAIAAGKSDFIFYPDDFVSLAGQTQQNRPFHNFIESCLDNHELPWIKSFLTTATERQKTSDEYVHHYSQQKLTILANILEVSICVIMLLIPVLLLFLVPMNKPMMAVVASISVVLFSVVVASVTEAKVQDVFFGSAAYSAVIIMFLGNLNSSSTSVGGS